MTIQILPRDDSPNPRKQGDMFILRKAARVATCALWSHPMGWDLRLDVDGEMIRTQLCRSQNEVLDTWEAWREAMLAKGWQ